MVSKSKGFLMQVAGGRPKRTRMEVVMINLKKCHISKDLASDRLGWRNNIHVANPNLVGTYDASIRHGYNRDMTQIW